ncbi:hypothetical protein G7Y79_00013g034380 [Physcia stellaris]|nr:hypothetical protein G7Y79_00013g034380 [Physcia stellaris]
MFSIFGNNTNIVSWVDDPNRRGTSGILSSCIITMVLCVWTALHLNLPHHSHAKQKWYAKRHSWRKFGWLVLTLLAPEFAVYTAWFQYREARKVKNLGISVRNEVSVYDPGAGPDKKWSMVHAFYAVMGGFVIDVGDGASFLPGQRRRMTLTVNGIEFIARRYPQLLPGVQEEDIEDRSKADALAKLVVCVQAAWFMTQCIGRIASGLPITLLELNVFGHSVCALVIYLFWWSKPLDVRQPMLIKGPLAESLLAFFWMSTKGLPVPYRGSLMLETEMSYLSLVAEGNTLSGHDPEMANTKKESVTQEIPLNQRLQRLGIRELWWNATPLLTMFWNTHIAKRKSSNSDEKATSVKLPRGKTLPRSRIRNDHEDVILEEEDIRRWHLAEDLLIKYKATGEDTRYEDTVTDRSSNWPPVDIDPKRLDKSLFIAFNVSGILYGGLHLLAWNAEFRTITEEISAAQDEQVTQFETSRACGWVSVLGDYAPNEAFQSSKFLMSRHVLILYYHQLNCQHNSLRPPLHSFHNSTQPIFQMSSLFSPTPSYGESDAEEPNTRSPSTSCSEGLKIVQRGLPSPTPALHLTTLQFRLPTPYSYLETPLNIFLPLHFTFTEPSHAFHHAYMTIQRSILSDLLRHGPPDGCGAQIGESFAARRRGLNSSF